MMFEFVANRFRWIDEHLRRLSGGDTFLLNIWRSILSLVALIILISVLVALRTWIFLGFAVLVGIISAIAVAWMLFRSTSYIVRKYRIRKARKSLEQPKMQERQAAKTKQNHSQASQTYNSFRWGYPPPTEKQFAYARDLGVELKNGMTKGDFSEAIDAALSSRPATSEQLETIKDFHAVLPRKITRGEANEIIDFLEDHYLPCPYCQIQICAIDQECMACGKDLRAVRIPIKID